MTGEEAFLKYMAAENERYAEHDARELLWAVWSKCQPNLSRPSGKHESDFMIVAIQFADFAIANIDLAREFISGQGSGRLATVLQMQRNAAWLDLECTVCQRVMREHSDEVLIVPKRSHVIRHLIAGAFFETSGAAGPLRRPDRTPQPAHGATKSKSAARSSRGTLHHPPAPPSPARQSRGEINECAYPCC